MICLNRQSQYERICMRFFNLKNEVQKKIFIYTTSLVLAILAYLMLSRMNDIGKFIGRIFDILLPFFIGFGIAFLLNGPVMSLETRLRRFRNLKPSTIRLIATIVVFLIFILFVVFAIWVIVPSLFDSISNFIENFSSNAGSFEKAVENLAIKYDLDYSQIEAALAQLNLSATVTNFMQSYMSKIMSYSVNLVHGLYNVVIGIAAALYMMLDKENLLKTFKTLMFSFISKDRANFVTLYSMDAKNVFQQYIVGNLLDSLVVGLVCWLGMVILRIPYAPMIGFIIGVTNIIPVFGPFLGAIPVILLLLLIHPVYAFIFAIFILVLQQIDGNVLKPIILGDKLGISGFWILFSVTVGGAIGGVLGMFLGVPVFALIYEAVTDLTEMRLNEKHLVINDNTSVVQ